MKMWLVYALMTVFLWGLWGFFSKLATRSLNTPDILLASAFGQFLFLAFYLVPISKTLNFRWMNIDIGFAILAGFSMMAGILLFYRALTVGDVTPIVLITACYPLVTLFLAFILLNESISFIKILGAFLTITGICLVSI
jgi:bacterial/archaeal transporter family protein